MRKLLALFIIIFSFCFLIVVPQVQADEIEDLQKQISDLEKQLDQSKKSTTPLEGQVKDLDAQIVSINAKVVQIQRDILKSEDELAAQKKILARTVRNFYIRSFIDIPLLTFFESNDATDTLRTIAYQQSSSKEDKNTIRDIGTKVAKLADDKKRLASAKLQIDKQSQFYKKEISNAKAFQSELQGKISALSARQQEILSEKSGTFQTTVGDVPLADDKASRPDYNPGFSPAFAAFSFGAPHFNGLSQYGAYGRAKDGGQNAEAILRAYYGDVEIKKDYDTGANICVGGSSSSCTNVPLETYAKRIYEMPGSWGDNGGMEALKAQAVAARSYALSSMARSGSICSSESCQVYKPENKGGKWDEAVNATAGWVMMKNGKPLMAKYASTSGGYIDPYTDSYSGHTTPGFWDTPSGRSGWTSQAYEKTAGSPWFYKGWYRSRSGDSCGRSHPWLTSDEMADILNGWVVLFEGGGDTSRVTPLGSCWGGNPYSMNDLKSIGGFTSVSGVSVTYSEGGTTATVTFQTNKGPRSINGDDFYKVFNVRAPGNLALKSGLFNIEKK